MIIVHTHQTRWAFFIPMSVTIIISVSSPDAQLAPLLLIGDITFYYFGWAVHIFYCIIIVLNIINKYMGIILRLLINTLAILGVAYFVPGITVDSFLTAFIVALVLGLINALILPLVKLLTLPINVMTLGLFSLVINILVFWLVSLFIPGFTVSGIFDAIIGALIIAVISWLTNIFIKK